MRSLAVAMMLVGCGGGIDAKDYASQLRDANCELRTRCGQFPDVASCEAYFPIGDDSGLRTAIDRGVVHYDGDKAQECINDLANSPCDQTSMEARNLPDACAQAVTGTIAVGATCTENAECESAACSLPSCGEACCTGMCVGPPVESELGGPCATVECEDGLVCDNTKTCVNLYAAGTPCLLSSDCAYGLACAGEPGICKPAPKLGEPCPDLICAELGTYCSASGTCTALGLPGTACTDSTTCSSFYPCNITLGHCQANPIVGEHCNGLCSDGSFCDSATATCTTPLANGAECSSDLACESRDCDDSQNPKICIEPTSCF
jgi:hypothetical protein